MATDIERLTVVLEANIKKYEREMARTRTITDKAMRDVERSASSSMKRLEGIMSGAGARLKAGLAGALAGLSVREVAQLADSYTKVQNSLKVAGLEGQKLKVTYEALYAVSQRQAAPLEAMASLYGKLSMAQTELNATGPQMLKFTEGVGMALKIQGTSAGEASGALLQLAQAMGGGVVRAEEYNSLLEGARPLLQAAAAGMVEAGGSVARLTALVKDGKVSSEAFFRAVLAGMPVLEKQADSAATTMSQGWSKTRDALVNLVGKLDEAGGMSKTAGDAFNGVANAIGGIADRVPAAVDALNSLQAKMTEIGNSSVFKKIYEGASAIGLGGMNGVVDTNKFDAAFGAPTNAGSMRGYKPPSATSPIVPIRNSDYAVPGADKNGRTSRDRVDEYERETASIAKRTAALDAERAVVGKSAGEVAKAEASFKLLEAAKAANVAITPQLLSDIDAMATKYGEATTAIEAARDAQEGVAEAMRDFQSTAKDAVSGFVSDLRRGESAADAFGNTLDRLADKVVDMALNAAFSSNKSGLGGLGSIFSSLFGGGGGVSMNPTGRASGGLVRTGTPYTVGESGRETFVPTTPGRIIPHGSGAGSTIVNIVNNSGEPVSQKKSKTAGGERIDVMIGAMVAQQTSTPGSPMNKAVRTMGGGMPLTRR